MPLALPSAPLPGVNRHPEVGLPLVVIESVDGAAGVVVAGDRRRRFAVGTGRAAGHAGWLANCRIVGSPSGSMISSDGPSPSGEVGQAAASS